MGTRYPLRARLTLRALQARVALGTLRTRSTGQSLLTPLTRFATQALVSFRALRAGFTLGALLTLEPINEKPLTAIPNGKLINLADNIDVSRCWICNVL